LLPIDRLQLANFLSPRNESVIPVASGKSVMGRKGTPFPHLQFMAQTVPRLRLL